MTPEHFIVNMLKGTLITFFLTTDENYFITVLDCRESVVTNN